MIFFKHTRCYFVPYSTPTTVKNEEGKTPHLIIYLEKCYGCGKMRTITVTMDQPPVIRESEER